MEDEGEEDESKKRPKTSGNKVKRRKRVTDKTGNSLSNEDKKEESNVPNLESSVTKLDKSKKVSSENLDSDASTKNNLSDENKNEQESSLMKNDSMEISEKAEESEQQKSEIPNSKLGKAVSFSPSTEFLGDAISADELSLDDSNKTVDKSEKDSEISKTESLSDETTKKTFESPRTPELSRKHNVALTTVFLNSPTEPVTIQDAVEEIIEIEGIVIEDELTITNGENKEVELTITEFEFLNLSRNEFKADGVTIADEKSQIEIPETAEKTEPKNDMQELDSNITEGINKIDSPKLPPRNGTSAAPETHPKSDSADSPILSRKNKGAPILSAMKKMVEKPMNIIKQKMESKSPTRKGTSGKESEPIISKDKKIEVKTIDVSGSPPLPPRNKPDVGSPKSIRSNDSTKSSPQVLSSETTTAHSSLRNFFSDDPKKFNSLQPKRNNGSTVRFRESSLPPPAKPEDGRKSPKVPPKTYMWEELRRTKLKGGYPWTHLYKGSFDEAKWKEIMEHEYEYVDPRPELLRPEPIRPQTGVRLSPRGSPRVSPRATPEPEIPKVQRRFIRIKDSDQVIIPLHGSSDEEHNPDRYDDPSLIGQEEIGITPPVFLANPSPSPSRRKVENEQKLSEKLRTTAEQLGTKIKNISLPDKSKIRLPEKPKFIADIQQMKLPDKPKFLTEKPKFLTEKPKFLTEKPKFLTEKPKFLTEKPKFLTEKPKFLTEKPKFLTEKPKFLTEKPKFLTERPKFMKEGIKFPDTSKINMPSIKLPKARRLRPKKETKTSAMSEFGSDKNIFHTIKARTYPRFLNKKKRLGTKKATPPPPPGQTRFDSESLPSTPRSKRNDQWTDVYKQKKTAEEGKVPSYVNGESFHERYSKREAKRASSSSIVDSDREQASSGSSGQRHRAGVIEEIDSDEFFVRVKGISREDVQVSKYLSSEIRDAFRSPKNALASLDKEDFDDEEPVAPHRSKKPKEYPRKEYNTFPLRPSRSKKGRNTMEKPPRRFRKTKPSGSLPSLDRDRDFDMEVDEILPETKEPPMAPKRRKSAKDLGSNDHWTSATEPTIVPDEVMALDSEIKVDLELPPVAPVRKARSRGTSLADEDRTSRGAESLRSDMQIEDELNVDFNMEDDNKSKSIKEVDDGKQRFIMNAPLEKSAQDSPTYSNVSKSRPPRPPPPDKEKPSKLGPHHRLKSKLLGHRHVRQLQTWKDQGVNFFFTYPRRAMKTTISKLPKRPTRNYSTIAGPSRPPRRHKVFREPVYVDADIEPVDSIPFIDDEEKLKSTWSEEAIGGMKGRPLPLLPDSNINIEDNRGIKETTISERNNLLNNLASKDNISETLNSSMIEESSIKSEDKMQGRPLPPPPRRKRGSSSTERKRESITEDSLNDFNVKDDETINARMTIDIIEPVTIFSVEQVEPSHVEDKLDPSEILTKKDSDKTEATTKTAEISQQTSFEVVEINVSVQTDPLPEGSIVDETDEICLKNKPHESDEEPSIEKYLEKYGSEIKMLGRQAAPTAKPVSSEMKPSVDRKEELLDEKHISINETEPDKQIVDKTSLMEEEVIKKENIQEERKEQQPVPIIFPDRLHLSHLDVDNLSVSSLKASQIIVSDLSGESLQVTELTSKGGNLVVSGMEFPPSFLQSLASEISAKVEEKLPPTREPEKPQEVISQEEKSQSLSKPESPLRPQRMKVVTATAPPTVIIQPTSESSSSEVPEAGVLSISDSIPTPRTTRNRGKKSNDSTRIVDDSEDELATTIKASSRSSSPPKQAGPSSSGKDKEQKVQPSTSGPPTTAAGLTARQLLIELIKIWKNCVTEGFSACSNTIGAMFPEGQKRRDAQKAACILFVIIIGLFALGFGTDNTVHYHHWDYVPPRL